MTPKTLTHAQRVTILCALHWSAHSFREYRDRAKATGSLSKTVEEFERWAKEADDLHTELEGWDGTV